MVDLKKGYAEVYAHADLSNMPDAGGAISDHDARYYTETELGSTTGGSEGASLIGTDTKTNLNNATDVETALTHLASQDPNWDAAYAHVSSDGSDHSFINQDVTTTGTPTFAELDVDNVNINGSAITHDVSASDLVIENKDEDKFIEFITDSSISAATSALRLGGSGASAAFGDANATGQRSLAFGLVNGAGVITASGTGSFAGGEAHSIAAAGTILASGVGSFAFGTQIAVVFSNQSILASGLGSVAMGVCTTNSTLTATGQGAFALGQDVNATADNTFAIGKNFTNATANTIRLGINSGDFRISATQLIYIGNAQFGFTGGAGNYLNIGNDGDVSFFGTAGFYPRRIRQAAIPASGTGATQIDTGEMLIWEDSDDDSVHFVYNDTTAGIKSVALT